MRVLSRSPAALRVATSRRRERPRAAGASATQGHGGQPDAADAESRRQRTARSTLQEGQARALLRTLVDFRETMVREVMTPRPDIVAIAPRRPWATATRLFREQQYSRVPVFQDSLDNVLGFVFVKDLIQRRPTTGTQPITPLIRPAIFVPETKRVVESAARSSSATTSKWRSSWTSTVAPPAW